MSHDIISRLPRDEARAGPEQQVTTNMGLAGLTALREQAGLSQRDVASEPPEARLEHRPVPGDV